MGSVPTNPALRSGASLGTRTIQVGLQDGIEKRLPLLSVLLGERGIPTYRQFLLVLTDPEVGGEGHGAVT